MKVVVVSKTTCPYCVSAKAWLKEHNVAFEEVVKDDTAERQAFYAEHGNIFGSVPQIFVDGNRIGGYTDLIKSQFAADLVAQKAAGNFNADF
jgi:glutaredoxin 3